MRSFVFFLAFFAAFFSLGVRAGCFLFSLLLFCPLLITISPALSFIRVPVEAQMLSQYRRRRVNTVNAWSIAPK